MPRAVISFALAALVFAAPAAAERVLVFSKTAGYRHPSIPDGLAALRELGAAHDVAIDATEDAAWFTEERLATYDAVVFLSTTGDVLDAAQQRAFERYIQAGGAFVGIHAASDTEYDWPWYRRTRRRVLRGPPRGAAERLDHRGPRASLDANTSARAGSAPTSGTTSATIRAARCTC